ncbi:hypothetical protein NDU88_004786 [Pleurodeles waltl]|uniref:Uncharacterized protein n=1 Tax=Pleurodeles waltl TaxID=8319 RepID=A0AAV7SJV4_PLEWA|nr:hypothetical protein NDU88_004786 [Pleurodeles waltl]
MPPWAHGRIIAPVTTRSEVRESEEEAPTVSGGHWRREALEVRRVRILTSGVALRDERRLGQRQHWTGTATRRSSEYRSILPTTPASIYQGLEDLRMKKLGDTDKISLEDDSRKVISKGKKGKSAGPDGLPLTTYILCMFTRSSNPDLSYFV